MQHESDESSVKEGILNAAKEGKLDQLKKHDTADILKYIEDTFKAAYEGAQLTVMKYLWEVCEQGDVDPHELEVWEGVINHEIYQKAFREGQWDLMLWFFGTFARSVEAGGSE